MSCYEHFSPGVLHLALELRKGYSNGSISSRSRNHRSEYINSDEVRRDRETEDPALLSHLSGALAFCTYAHGSGHIHDSPGRD